MAHTITYVTRKDIYGVEISTPIYKLELKDFLINVHTLSATNSVIFTDDNGATKTLR